MGRTYTKAAEVFWETAGEYPDTAILPGTPVVIYDAMKRHALAFSTFAASEEWVKDVKGEPTMEELYKLFNNPK